MLPTTPPPRAMRDAIARAVADAAFNRYPDPAAPALKAKLREKLYLAGAWHSARLRV